MKKFEEPKFDIIEFTSQDIIVTSGGDAIIQGPPPIGGGSNPGPDGPWDDEEE